MTISKSSIWGVPAHITGVFQIIEHENPMMMGSRGAGFSISRRINTRVSLFKTKDKNYKFFLMNKKLMEKLVSKLQIILEIFLRIHQLLLNIKAIYQ